MAIGRSKRGKIKPLGAMVSDIAQSAFDSRGFYEAAILTDWPQIVGPLLARQSCPERLRRNGTLAIRVNSGFALELQHLEPVLLDRIATYFGFRAVKKLALRQGPIIRPTAKPAATEAPARYDSARLRATLADMDDGPLKDALTDLGKAVLARPKGDRRH